MTLHIHLLGPPKFGLDADLIDVPGRRPQALLAYLLVTGVAHSRQHLVDLLFEGPDDPRAALRWTLAKLRGAIGADYILADRQAVTFNFESDHWLDLAAFEAGQIDLYRGDFLEGLHVRDAYRFEDWTFFERERLRGSYQEALTVRLGEYEERGDDTAVVEIAHQLLRLDNLREDWYRALMWSYARLGKRDAALAQYARCRQVLEAELGVEPVEQTVGLAQEIEAGHLQPELRELRAARAEVPPVLRTAAWLRFPTSLVGREAEMATLRQAWRLIGEGVGQLVLVEGEPGIGKTRLIEELLAEVAGRAIALRAKCSDLEEPLAYTLFVDPLRQALAEDPPPGLSQAWLAELTRLLPDVRDRYPDLPQPAQLEPDAERRRLFEAVCAALMSMAEEQPLVLFLDDLQWTDLTSLEVLSHLSAQISQAPVLVIGAYRPHEVEAGHPLDRHRADWERTRLLTNLSLGPLSVAAVADLLAELTTWRGDDPSFRDLIYRETGGNPLFVVEAIASLRDEGRLPESAESWARDFQDENLTIPSQVQAIIETRLNRLDELSRQMVTAAAVIRGNFDADVLQMVSGRSELETLESLERLLAGRLLVEQAGDKFSFSHDKIREVAYAGLSQLRRKLLHRRLAETLEGRHRGREKTVAERLAYHFERAGVPDKALDYHLQAAHTAREQYAHQVAVGHYQKALAYLEEQKNYERAARTLMQLGLTYHTAFDFKRSRQAYQEGFALWEQVGHTATAAPQLSAPHALRMQWGNPPTLDPTLSPGPYASNLIRQLFSGLVELSPDMDVIPDVARSWEVSEGGRSYVFHLRDDVCWSDGVPVTAGDFEFAWKRVLDPAIDSFSAEILYDVKGARAFHRGESGADEVGVRALDEVTLAVNLEEPTAYFIHLLAYVATYPVPRHALEAHGLAWTQVGNIVSNGPFKLHAWVPGQSMVFTRNPNYHRRFAGNVERVELCLSPDRSPAELELYEAGKTDAIGLVAMPSEAVSLDRRRRVGEYVTAPHLILEYVAFDVRRPPFDDPKVRRAFVMSADRERLADVVLRGYASPATGGFVPPGMPGHSAEIGLPYDPEAARHLLAEAGYPGGAGFPPIDMPAIRGWEPSAAYLAAQWRENLGVEITWATMHFLDHADRLERDLPHLYLRGWLADYPDPDNFLRLAVSEIQGYTSWHNQTYDRLVGEAMRVMDHEARMTLYQRADRILVEEAAIMPLLYGRANLLVKPWVRNYLVPPIGAAPWKHVIIEPH